MQRSLTEVARASGARLSPDAASAHWHRPLRDASPLSGLAEGRLGPATGGPLQFSFAHFAHVARQDVPASDRARD